MLLKLFFFIACVCLIKVITQSVVCVLIKCKNNGEKVRESEREMLELQKKR